MLAVLPQEGSCYNLIEHNVCEEQKDPESGCFGLRGSDNTVRWNEISDCEGAGVRMGGEDGYGEGNHVYGNVISDCEYAAFKVPFRAAVACCALLCFALFSSTPALELCLSARVFMASSLDSRFVFECLV